MFSQHATAILVFARSAAEEVRHKNISRADRLFDALTEHTISTVEKARIPFFHITEDFQIGSSFGERFVNAVQFVFDKGFENVITVGNDSPHLNKSHILGAISKLEGGKAVIGPSADGGFYLMGIHNSDFKKSDFEGLSWQTSSVKSEIISLLSKSGKEIEILSTLLDLDSFADVKIINNNRSRLAQKVVEAILYILSSKKKIDVGSIFFVDRLQSQPLFNKGSPIAVFS